LSIRDERAAALTRRHRDLADDFTRTLPLLLDDLDAIDAAQPELAEARTEAAELRHECDSLAALLVEAAAERDRLRELLGAASIADPQPAAPAKPAPRRRDHEVSEHEARPTLYKGKRMRSRLEADYARHLDEVNAGGPESALHFEWHYESECFAGPDGQWLPDFVKEFPKVRGYREFIEVKPAHIVADAWKKPGNSAAIDGILLKMSQAWLSDPAAVLVLDFWLYGAFKPKASIVGCLYKAGDRQDDDFVWSFRSEDWGHFLWDGPVPVGTATEAT
jgi:hypothetical protein